jgi:hypothetical protein
MYATNQSKFRESKTFSSIRNLRILLSSTGFWSTSFTIWSFRAEPCQTPSRYFENLQCSSQKSIKFVTQELEYLSSFGQPFLRACLGSKVMGWIEGIRIPHYSILNSEGF